MTTDAGSRAGGTKTLTRKPAKPSEPRGNQILNRMCRRNPRIYRDFRSTERIKIPGSSDNEGGCAVAATTTANDPPKLLGPISDGTCQLASPVCPCPLLCSLLSYSISVRSPTLFTLLDPFQLLLGPQQTASIPLFTSIQLLRPAFCR